jgi:hypothetical protein
MWFEIAKEEERAVLEESSESEEEKEEKKVEKGADFKAITEDLYIEHLNRTKNQIKFKLPPQKKGFAEGKTSNGKITGSMRCFGLPFEVTKWLMNQKDQISKINSLVQRGKVLHADTEAKIAEDVEKALMFFEELEA